jgi:hypothetical protein
LELIKTSSNRAVEYFNFQIDFNTSPGEKKETIERLGEREKVQLRRIHDKMARLRKTSVRNESNRYWKLFHADKVVIAHELKLSITIRH